MADLSVGCYSDPMYEVFRKRSLSRDTPGAPYQFPTHNILRELIQGAKMCNQERKYILDINIPIKSIKTSFFDLFRSDIYAGFSDMLVKNK